MSDELPDKRAKEFFQRIIQLRLPVRDVQLKEENGLRMKGLVTVKLKNLTMGFHFTWVGCEIMYVKGDANITSIEMKYPTTKDLIRIIEKHLKKEK